jgi:hypothetical protein
VQHMRDSLELLRKHFKDFLYYRNMRHIKIGDPGMDIRGLSIDEVWGESAIHTQPLVYCRIAAAIIRIADSMEQVAGNKRRRSDSIDGAGCGGNNDLRGRHHPDTRQDWRNQDGPRGRGLRGGRGRGSGRGENYSYKASGCPVPLSSHK